MRRPNLWSEVLGEFHLDFNTLAVLWLLKSATSEVAHTDSFPVVPVPLLPADGDLILNLPLVYQKCYDENGFAQLV